MFDATHVEVKRWFDEGLVDGVRIDHPDGLSDPAGYLVWLRELIGPQAWIVIEKILAVDEALDPMLPVAGTTGYDALREIGGLLVDPTGKQALTQLEESAGIDYNAMPELAHRLKAGTVTDTLGSELRRLCRVIGSDDARLPDAVAALISHIRRVPVRLSLVVLGATGRARRNGRRVTGIGGTVVGCRCGFVGQHRGRRAIQPAVRGGDREVDGGLPVLP